MPSRVKKNLLKIGLILVIMCLLPAEAFSQKVGFFIDLAHRGQGQIAAQGEMFSVTGLSDDARKKIIAVNRTHIENLQATAVTNEVNISAAGRGLPFVNFEDGKTLASDGENLTDSRGVALAAADFDADGVEDLAVVYANENGGFVSIRRGNLESIFPPHPGARPSPFLSETRESELLLIPDFLAAGDFNADGRADLLAAQRGFDSLILLVGNGDGNFAAPLILKLNGAVTAFATGEVNNFDNLADVAVGIIENNQPKVLIFQSRGGAFSAEPKVLKTSQAVNALALGDVDAHAAHDLIAAAGNEITFVSGSVGGKITAENISIQRVDFQIAALAIGDFTGKRENEVAVLSEDGELCLSEPHAIAGGCRQRINTPATAGGSDLLIAAKVSTRQKTDLIIGGANSLNLVTNDGTNNFALAATFDITDAPIAALPMRLNKDALADLVVLTENSAEPSFVLTAPVAIHTVTTASDQSVNGSLRKAIEDANAAPGLDEIRFALPDPSTPIVTQTALPDIEEATTLDGTSQSGFIGQPVIEIVGDSSGARTTPTLTVTGGSTVLRGLISKGSSASANAIVLTREGNNFVEGTFIGTDRDGTASSGTGKNGLVVESDGNTIGGAGFPGRNIISGSTGSADSNGILITGANNRIENNYIGLTFGGLEALGNSGCGVRIDTAASGNVVGGATTAKRNVISGNARHGVAVIPSANSSSDAVIENNFIGTNKNGDAAIANGAGGLYLEYVLSGNPAATATIYDNVISGNTGDGIAAFRNFGSFRPSNVAPEGGASFLIDLALRPGSLNGAGTVPTGNRIGTNAAGTAALPNTGNGVSLVNAPALIEGNTISGNGISGISISGEKPFGNFIADNFIGTNATATAAIGNTGSGIKVEMYSEDVASETQTTRIYDNVISGNTGDGVFASVVTSPPERNATPEGGITFLIDLALRPGNQNGAENAGMGNRIGTNADGTAAIPNGGNGVNLQNAAAKIEYNLISGNGANGVQVSQSSFQLGQLNANRIGTNASGSAAIPNNGNGVSLNLVTTLADSRAYPITDNLISGNAGDGVRAASNNSGQLRPKFTPQGGIGITVDIHGSRSRQNPTSGDGMPDGNYIGVNLDGTAAIPNGGNGIHLTNVEAIVEGNLISANSMSGIYIKPPMVTDEFCEITDNYIGTDAGGNLDLGNAADGITFEFPNDGERPGTSRIWSNVISGNQGDGVRIFRNVASGEHLAPEGGVTFLIDLARHPSGNSRNSAAPEDAPAGNKIGTNATGTAPLGNTGNGVSINDVPTKLGGDAPADGNIIAHNGANGVAILSGTNNYIRSNSIHSNTLLDVDLGGDGVSVNDLLDADTGANGLQNYPTLATANSDGSITHIAGALNSKANNPYLLVFYSTANCVGSKSLASQTQLGTVMVTTDAAGNAVINASFAESVPANHFVTANAIDFNPAPDAADNTSEFSLCTQVQAPAATRAPFDFDGDGRTDIAIFRPSDGNWHIIRSSDNTLRVQQWGTSTDVLVPADYDGDGTTDIAVFRPSEGNWYIIQSTTGTPALQNWGGGADVPVPGDYDGDDRADTAIFRPSEGNWYIRHSSNGTVTVRGWGLSTDKLVPGDYDGDGLTDIAVYRPTEGNWYIVNSATNTATQRNWGTGTDRPVPGDYDGDGRTDLAVFRPGEGAWYIIQSATNTVAVRNWGVQTDRNVLGDFDGDRRTDIAVWRETESNWYIIRSETNTASLSQHGLSNDVPVPSVYVPQ